MKRWFFVLLAVLSIGVVTAFATVRIVIDEVLPNTSDDTNLEYIEIGNIDCLEINLSGYVLRDASGKTYLLSWNMASGSRMKIMRPESKIILNNTDERIDLLDASGALIDQFSYSTSSKDIALSTGHFVLPVCPPIVIDPPVVEPDPVTNTGGINTTQTWGVQTGSVQTWSTQTGTIDTNTGGIVLDPLLPVTSTGSQNSDTSSGSAISTGATSTGLTSAGTSSSGTIPETPANNTGTVLAGTGGTATHTGSTSTGATGEIWNPPPQVSSSGSSVTWSVGSWNAFTGATFTGELDPDKLLLYDLDSNGKIDQLVIRYPFTLTGTLDISKLIVYSATGGLSDARIESSTGIIRALAYSGNLLQIDLIEWNIEHLDLKINTTTTSDLRLKTYTGFWLQTLDGRSVNPLTYTKSFHAYSGAYIENTAYTPPLVVPTASWGGSSSYTTENVIIYGRSLSDPKIAVQSGLTPENICKSTPCRVNFIATPKFTYEKCNWVFDGANVENRNLTTCNPSQIEFRPWNHQVTLYYFEEWNPTNTISYSMMVYEKKSEIISWNHSWVSSLPKSTKKSSTLPILAEVLVTPTVELLYEQITHALSPLVASSATSTAKKPTKKKTAKLADTKKVTSTPTKAPKKTALKKPPKPKKATVKKPKVLAVKKAPATPKAPKTSQTTLKNPQNPPENTLSPIARAAAAGGLACVAGTGGYFVGRRRKISCSDTVVS